MDNIVSQYWDSKYEKEYFFESSTPFAVIDFVWNEFNHDVTINSG